MKYQLQGRNAIQLILPKTNTLKNNTRVRLMQGFQNVLKWAADSRKAGGCDNRDCLSRADCYDQSSRRHTVNYPAELRRSPACFETPAYGEQKKATEEL